MKISSFLTPRTSIKKDYRKLKFTSEERHFLDEYKKRANYSETKPCSWSAKRVIDVAGSAAGLVLSAPLMFVSALAIKADSKGPVIFKQKRIGKDGKPFDIYKLRTMYDDNANCYAGVHGADDPRITRVGKVLRKFSIDEFPQFINILKGNMSLIGPRPLSEKEFIQECSYPEFAGRCAVKPGAKLEYGRMMHGNHKDWFGVEKDYIENWSPKKDIKAFVRIVKDVVFGNNY